MIGKVRIVQMHPEKKLLLRVLRQPVQRHIGDDVAGTLHLIEIRFIQAAEIEMVVVEIESLVQSEARVEHRRRNHRSRRYPACFSTDAIVGCSGLSLLALKSCMPLSIG